MNGEVAQYVVRTGIGLLVSIGAWFFMYPLRTMIKDIKTHWKALSTQVTDLQTELTLQRTNCLTTLQQQGKEQVNLLKEVSGTLKDINLSQAEMTGYIKGSTKR